MKYLLLEEVDSTNSYASVHAAELEDMTMILADSQTAGRGQRGNSWESAPGENLTFTLFCRPEGVAPREQFAISEATALAVADYLAATGIEAKVKWPNDIYVGDKKICGILIEHSLRGNFIEHSRIGVGININQTEFLSDAPNPVSVANVTGRRLDPGHQMVRVGSMLEARLKSAATPEGRESLHKEFLGRLWRGDGNAYPFRRRSDGMTFEGVIEDVDPAGPLIIRDADSGERQSYMFKEVEFLL